MKKDWKAIKRPQSGNAAWKAAMRAHGMTKGRTNRRICKAIARHSGLRCGQLAMSGQVVCHIHGGRGLQAIERINEAKRQAQTKRTNSISQANATRYKRAGKATKADSIST